MEENLKEFIKEYIKENLSLSVDQGYDVYCGNRATISLELEGETISEDLFYLDNN